MPDPLAAKRRRLYDLISEKRKARQRAAVALPELDLNEVATAFNGPESAQLKRDIEGMTEETLDLLIEHHSPTAIRYVW